MYKKAIYIIIIIFFVTSCETMSSVKRGLTGEKKLSTDEFMVEKKDPLIMPPDYENLPTPEDRVAAKDEISTFEESLGTSIEDDSISSPSSTEGFILKKIQSN
tara:strand:+ start:740 stop:1048 length:309 start_codon:yes stop_codon:yes gene_type:complete